MLSKIFNFINNGNPRSVLVKKNIIASAIFKGISILISLQIVPLTIGYINSTKYGIWLTLSSIISWLSYFDLGFANGFRNKFAEAKAKNDVIMARSYVSTTYMVLTILFSLILVVTLCINNYLDWGAILKIDKIFNDELKKVFSLLACFFCLNIVASVFTTMLTADQKNALTSCIITCGQLLALLSVYILTKCSNGNLIYLAIAFSGVPCLFLLFLSIFFFCRRPYNIFMPSFKYVKFNLVNNILGLGAKFFIIMISMLFIYQFINIIISRNVGPEGVTQYNIAYKYFNIVHMVAIIIVTPFWSAFTDAYTKKEYSWMQNALKKLEKFSLLCVPMIIIMLFLSKYFYKFWIGNSVFIPIELSLAMGFYVLSQTLAGIYMYLINGTGKVQLQLVIYVTFAIFSLPIINYACKEFGVSGAVILPALVFLIQVFVARIQIKKIVNNTATGIWLK